MDGGQVPLGYTVADGKLVVSELEAVVIREIVRLVSWVEQRAAFDSLGVESSFSRSDAS